MQFLIKPLSELHSEDRWDIDYHLPSEELQAYLKDRLVTVSQLATDSKLTRDPRKSPQSSFQYIDISSIDVATGAITSVQELTGEEAPSRARQVVHAFDVLVSTVRPTRGATAVVPPELHNQVASTGYCVLRCKADTNPYYLHYVLRLPSTLEQFRKFATGSSYPAILTDDVLKTQVPLLSRTEQDRVADVLLRARKQHQDAVQNANYALRLVHGKVRDILSGTDADLPPIEVEYDGPSTTAQIVAMKEKLLSPDAPLFDQADDNAERDEDAA